MVYTNPCIPNHYHDTPTYPVDRLGMSQNFTPRSSPPRARSGVFRVRVKVRVNEATDRQVKPYPIALQVPPQKAFGPFKSTPNTFKTKVRLEP